ncbi:MAG: transporter [Candidatus Polarisedimenticolia bacterium]
MRIPLVSATSIALMLLHAAPAGAAVHTAMRLEPSYMSQKYDGGATLDLTALPVTFVLRSSRVSFRATLPYLRLEAATPDVVLGGPILRIPIEGRTLAEEGPGDLILTPAVLLHRDGPEHPSVWGGLRLKVPTADEEEYLGTGKADLGPTLGMTYLANSRLLFLGGLRYTVRGDPPDVDLENTLTASAGARIRAALRNGVTVGVARGESSLPGGDVNWSASLSYDHLLANRTTILTTAFTDLSGEARGYGISLGFVFREDPFDWGT